MTRREGVGKWGKVSIRRVTFDRAVRMKPLVLVADAGHRDYVSCIGFGRARVARACIIVLGLRLEDGK